jgi:hypothetical protein
MLGHFNHSFHPHCRVELFEKYHSILDLLIEVLEIDQPWYESLLGRHDGPGIDEAGGY